MSDPAGIHVDAFFDGPALLAVRLSRPGVQASRVQRFASRNPDHAPASSQGGVRDLLAVLKVGGVIVAGVVVVGAMFMQESQALPDDGGQVAVEADNRPRDAGGTTAWAGTLERLAEDLRPARADLVPFMVRTLLEVPAEIRANGRAMPGWVQPGVSAADQQAHVRARLLAGHLTAAASTDGIAVILDLPGPQAVAAAAGLSRVGDAVFTMDNLPHPQGVVPADATLRAAIHWRPAILAARSGRTGQPMPVFVLDANRLMPYGNTTDRFDNRSRARLPSAEAMRALGVTTVIYVRPSAADLAEPDDLNVVLLAYTQAGLTIRPLGLDSVEDRREERPAAATSASSPSSSGWLWYHLMIGRNESSDERSPHAVYRAVPRPQQPIQALDGGAGQRSALIRGLPAAAPPAPPRTSGTSHGGSWGRSSSSSSHSFGG